MADSNVGVITEQGDLGLGFSPITDDEKKKIKKNLDDDEESGD